jgi:hypothetical protein
MRKLILSAIFLLFWFLNPIAYCDPVIIVGVCGYGIYGPCNSVNDAEAAFAPGATSLVFQQSTSALTATPNVRVCLMNQGMPQDHGTSGGSMQSLVCDSILGYYLGKKLTVPVTASSYFVIQVDQATKYNHDGSLTNYLLLPSGGSWGEAVR